MSGLERSQAVLACPSDKSEVHLLSESRNVIPRVGNLTEEQSCVGTGCFKKSFTTQKEYINSFSVLKCHNIAKHTEFYLG
jgi:hypothetical protein